MSRSPESDSQAIRALIDGWPIWRDSGDWSRLLSAWHAGGTMSSTRFHGPAEEFVRQTKAAWERGAQVRHMQGGFWCDVRGDRAISLTGMEIRQRSVIHGIQADATCMGRFVDFLEWRDGRWGIVRRQPVYDRDRIDPVVAGETIPFDHELLESFPPEYRHLAYLQHQLGQTINRKLPAGRGPSYDALMAEAAEWLEDSAAARPPRRIVIGEQDGRSRLLSDEDMADGWTPVPGLRTRLVWATGTSPDYRSGVADIVVPPGIAPLPGGTRFSVLDLDPGHSSSHLHRTDTVDYVLCLRGPVEMLLDDGSVRLETGDIAIQRGTNHGWRNPGPCTARIAVVLLDAEPKRRDSISGAKMAP